MRNMMMFLYVLMLTLTAMGGDQRVAVGYGALDEDGDVSSWLAHYGDDDGIFLESLALDFSEEVKGLDTFSIRASGFGARPAGKFHMKMENKGAWTADLRYEERNSRGTGGVTDHNWDISRLRAEFTHDRPRLLRWRFRALLHERSGQLGTWFYGLGEPYARSRDVKERLNEYRLALETKTLPVKLVLEQSLSSYRHRRQTSPANNGNAASDDIDILTNTATLGNEKITAPATRLGASYANKRFSLAAFALWRKDKLDVVGDDVTVYDLAGGDIGSVAFGNQFEGESQRDTTLANMRLAYAFNSEFRLNLDADYRDLSTLGSTLGIRNVTLQGPGGEVVIGETYADLAHYDQNEESVRLEGEWRRPRFSVNAGVQDMSWSRDWQLGADHLVYSQDRDTDIYHVGANYFPRTGVHASLRWSSGSFGHAIFRNDPREVDKLAFKLRYKKGNNLLFTLHGSNETAKGFQGVTVDRDLTTMGGSVNWSNEKGSQVNLMLSRVELDSNTGIVFYAPELVGDFSVYHSDLRHLALLLQQPLTEKFGLTANLSHYEDEGDSVPMQHTDVQLRLNMKLGKQAEGGFFARRYDHDGSFNFTEYVVTHYGIVLEWRF